VCEALLGVERGGELHTKYKEAQWRIVGDCRCACRRCGALNSIMVVAKRPPPKTHDEAVITGSCGSSFQGEPA